MSTASFYAADGAPLGSQVIPDGQTVMLGPGLPVAAIQITPVTRQPEPAPEIPEPAGFRELVLAWLREKGDHPDAASVEKVSGWGTDWDGDTDGGFYDSFGVSIDWTDNEGQKHLTEPHGDAMSSLWALGSQGVARADRRPAVSTAAGWLVVRLHRLADRTEVLADWVERKFYRP